MGKLENANRLVTESIDLRQVIANAITEAFRALLEQKHLYQSHTLKPGDYLSRENMQIPIQKVNNILGGPWFPIDPGNRRPMATFMEGTDYFYFKVPDVKLFCARCDRVEPFNLLTAEEFFSRDISLHDSVVRDGDVAVQSFVFSMLCQSCKRVPEMFLVTRQGVKLTNTGRSPIEQVQVPAAIPKPVSRFFSGAVVAHQSGQTLAGLFLMRTLIEQWARGATSGTDMADEVIDAYMGTLPPDFRTRFHSMRDLYGELSADIHSATGSPELFDKAAEKISEHFEARKLFKL